MAFQLTPEYHANNRRLRSRHLLSRGPEADRILVNRISGSQGFLTREYNWFQRPGIHGTQDFHQILPWNTFNRLPDQVTSRTGTRRYGIARMTHRCASLLRHPSSQRWIYLISPSLDFPAGGHVTSIYITAVVQLQQDRETRRRRHRQDWAYLDLQRHPIAGQADASDCIELAKCKNDSAGLQVRTSTLRFLG